MRSMLWQLGILGTISAFAYRHRETEKNLCRGGRSQDLPSRSQDLLRHVTLQNFIFDLSNTDVKWPMFLLRQGKSALFLNANIRNTLQLNQSHLTDLVELSF